MKTLLQDFSYALRGLRKSPAFVGVAVVTLALGVGANTAIFSVTNSVLLRPHNFPGLDRLVVLREQIRGRTVEQTRLTAADASDIARLPVFQQAAFYQFRELNLARNGETDNATAFLVTPNLFPMLGVTAAQGRVFTSDEGQPGRDHVLLLSYRFWERRFGANPAVIGSTISIDGHDATVVGVMPRDFNYPPGAEVWKPLALAPGTTAHRSKEAVYTVARLAPGASLNDARAALHSAGARLQHDYPATNAGRDFSLLRLREEQYSDTAPLLLLLQAGATFVLVLACANLAVLVMIRLIGRRRELAVRTALGASHRRLLQLFLAEALLVCAAAGSAAVGASFWLVGLIRNGLAPSYTRWVAGWDNMHVDTNVLVAAAAIVVAVSLLLGIAAVLHAANIDPYSTLKEGGRGGTSRRHHAIRNSLVVVQVMLALVLLIGAGLVVSGFRRLQGIFAGLDPAHVVRFSVSLPESRYTPAQVADFFTQLQSRLEALPAVTGAALITNNPASNVPNPQVQFTIAGQAIQGAAEVPVAERQVVNERAFTVLHISVMEGRALSSSDGAEAPAVAVISHTLAQRYWPHTSSIGQRIRLSSAPNARWITIVGVVRDIQLNWFEAVPGAVIYLPYAQAPPRRATILARTAGDAAMSIAPVRRVLTNLDPLLSSGELNPYTVEVNDSLAPLRVIGILMLAFGIVATALSAVGIYGVVGHAVAQATHEFGVRLALGAARGDVFALVTGRALRITGIGLGLGSMMAFVLARFAGAYLFGVVALRPSVFVAFTGVLLTVSVVAALLPARRAARVDPMEALRQE